MIKRIKINLWLDQDLIQVLRIFNCQKNRLLFEHELKSCFLTHTIYNPIYILPDENVQTFNSYERTVVILSNIILRTKYIRNKMQELIESLNLLKNS